MQRSYLISLVFAVVVLLGGGLALIYTVDRNEGAPDTQESAESPTGSEQSGGQQTGSGQTGAESGQASSREPDSEQAAGTQEGAQSEDTAASESQSQAADQDAGASQPAGGTTGAADDSTTDSEPQATSSPSSTQMAATTEPPSGEETAPVAPSFDVVRVEPTGDTVIAGRAEPNAEVTILDNGNPLGTVTADERGEWVFLPDAPLPPGSRELSLESKDANGARIPSQDVVVMSVPEKKSGETEGTEDTGEAPLAVLMPREGSGGSQVLQAPSGEGIAEGSLVLEAVDYGEDGEITISGRASPGSTVRLYLDNELLGETEPDAEGRWTYALEKQVPYGVYQLRADQVNESGEVLARVETPFSRVEFSRAELPDEKFVIVQPGNSLWRIARSTLGEGVRYTVIYEANQDQIRDPDLIYPGQIFAVPQTN